MSKTRDLANLADLNFDSGTMVVDKVNDRVGVLNATPAHPFQVGTDDLIVDASSNVLVGKTSQTGTGVGIELQNNGTFYVGKTGDVATFNRTTSVDGTFIELQKQGSTVGSIGNASSDLEIYTPNQSGIILKGNNVSPMYQSSVSDNQTDLGRSANRWRNLYLSGGVYLGGTGSANYLDDYEEGFWTPTAITNSGTAGSIGTASGIYTKVGRLVTLIGVANNITPGGTAGSLFRIGGLPFTPANENSNGSAVWDSISFQGASTRFYLSPQAQTAGYIQFTQCGEDNADTPIDHSDLDALNRSDIRFTITYMV